MLTGILIVCWLVVVVLAAVERSKGNQASEQLKTARAANDDLVARLAWYDGRHDEPMQVTVRWSTARSTPDGDLHDHALVEWDFRSGHSVPWDAINRVLSKHYNQGFLPWVYSWWDADGEQRGVLITPTLDLERDEVTAVSNELLADYAQEGEWRKSIATLDA